jgi:hypothetical protein
MAMELSEAVDVADAGKMKDRDSLLYFNVIC